MRPVSQRFYLILFGLDLCASAAFAQTPGTFSATVGMTTPRAYHTATLLTNGKVLIAGGAAGSNPLATTELYDPDSGTFAPASDMTAPRWGHTATLLPDGRVLIAGGSATSQAFIPVDSAEIYDPSTGTFAVTGNMIFGHVCQQANLLGNGTVLIVGGSGANGRVPNAEIYDPATGTFTATGTYASDTSGFNTCQGGVSTSLPNGKVLIVWEEDAADLYDPNTGTFMPTGQPISQSYNDALPTATLLMNGQVLVAGGADDGDLRGASAELYDSGAGTFTATGNTITGHVLATATLLPDGTVLIAGSFLFPGAIANAELYRPATGTFTATGNMITARGDGYNATLLNSGQVLVTGGYAPYPAATSNAEIYHPAVLLPAPQLFSVAGDGRGQGAIWHGTTGMIASPSNPAVAGEALSMYTTSLFEGGVIPPQVAIGGRLAEILYFGDAPGYPGYYQVNFQVPNGVAPGPAVSVRLTYLSRPSNGVTIGVQ